MKPSLLLLAFGFSLIQISIGDAPVITSPLDVLKLFQAQGLPISPDILAKLATVTKGDNGNFLSGLLTTVIGTVTGLLGTLLGGKGGFLGGILGNVGGSNRGGEDKSLMAAKLTTILSQLKQAQRQVASKTKTKTVKKTKFIYRKKRPHRPHRRVYIRPRPRPFLPQIRFVQARPPPPPRPTPPLIRYVEAPPLPRQQIKYVRVSVPQPKIKTIRVPAPQPPIKTIKVAQKTLPKKNVRKTSQPKLPSYNYVFDQQPISTNQEQFYEGDDQNGENTQYFPGLYQSPEVQERLQDDDINNFNGISSDQFTAGFDDQGPDGFSGNYSFDISQFFRNGADSRNGQFDFAKLLAQAKDGNGEVGDIDGVGDGAGDGNGDGNGGDGGNGDGFGRDRGNGDGNGGDGENGGGNGGDGENGDGNGGDGENGDGNGGDGENGDGNGGDGENGGGNGGDGGEGDGNGGEK